MLPDAFAELLAQAQAGDEAAFTELFRVTQPTVLRYLRALAPHEMVDDVASEAWISVIRALGQFTDRDLPSFQAWVLTMARRRWIDELRRRGRRPESLQPTETLVRVPSSTDVEGEFDQQLSESPTLQLLKVLPPDQAEVVLLRIVAGLDVDRVAAIVGKKPGTVRVLSHRGLRRLEALIAAGVTNGTLSSVEGQR